MHIPVLIITPEAKEALKQRMETSGLIEPRATVLLASISGKPEWSVSLYDGADLPKSQKCIVHGIPFCFVQPKHQVRLDGATIQWANGKFNVEEKAI